MVDSIRLHQKKGLNPRLTRCRNCGKDVGVVLLGAYDHTGRCTNCNLTIIGISPVTYACPQCGRSALTTIKPINEYDKLPIELCVDCEKREAACAEEVKKGGVYWCCKDCGSKGALKAEAALSKLVRGKHGLAAPAPCGIEFSKDDCPVCGPSKVASVSDAKEEAP